MPAVSKIREYDHFGIKFCLLSFDLVFASHLCHNIAIPTATHLLVEDSCILIQATQLECHIGRDTAMIALE